MKQGSPVKSAQSRRDVAGEIGVARRDVAGEIRVAKMEKECGFCNQIVG